MTAITRVKISVDDEALLPTYASEGDAGCDLRASNDYIIPAGERVLVGTGVRLALSPGIVALVHPRSGLALRHGITVLNTPGTIDSGYRGEVGVILYNSSNYDFAVVRGDRIAQLVFQHHLTASFDVTNVEELDKTERGDGGFGSSGVA
jgi:dUTP pyrophosphatase